MIAAGVDAEIAARVRDDTRAVDPPRLPVELHPTWLASATLFLDCATQWHRAGQFGHAVGLDYSAIALLARLRRQRLTAEIMDDIQAMEAAALTVWSDAQARALAQAKAHGSRR